MNFADTDINLRYLNFIVKKNNKSKECIYNYNLSDKYYYKLV